MAHSTDAELLNGEIFVDSLSQLSEEEFCDASDNIITEQSGQNEVDEEILRRERESLLSKDELLDLKNESIQLKEEGNIKFKSKEFDEAASLYTKAIDKCPFIYETEHATLYGNRAAARYHLVKNDNDRKSVVTDCTKAIELNPTYLKPLMKRAVVLRELGSEHLDESLADYKKIVELDPSNGLAKREIVEITSEIESRNEKLKEEMMGKLKDLGNLVLSPFGLSTNNFQLNKNSETGGYSINFKQ